LGVKAIYEEQQQGIEILNLRGVVRGNPEGLPQWQATLITVRISWSERFGSLLFIQWAAWFLAFSGTAGIFCGAMRRKDGPIWCKRCTRNYLYIRYFPLHLGSLSCCSQWITELKSQTEVSRRFCVSKYRTRAEGLECMWCAAADASSDDHHVQWATHACGTCLPKQRMPWPLAIAVGRNAWFCFCRNVSVGKNLHSSRHTQWEFSGPNKKSLSSRSC